MYHLCGPRNKSYLYTVKKLMSPMVPSEHRSAVKTLDGHEAGGYQLCVIYFVGAVRPMVSQLS